MKHFRIACEISRRYDGSLFSVHYMETDESFAQHVNDWREVPVLIPDGISRADAEARVREAVNALVLDFIERQDLLDKVFK